MIKEVQCDHCGHMVKVVEKKSIHDWCNTCKHIRVDADYCMSCVDKSLENTYIAKPKGHRERK